MKKLGKLDILKNQRKLSLLVLLFFFTISILLFVVQPEPEANINTPVPVVVDTMELKKKNISPVVEYTGRLEPSRKADLKFEINGRLSKKLVQPRYQDVNSRDIPLLEDDDGSKIKVIVGDYKGITGPVDGIAADPQYLDVYVPPYKDKRIKIDAYKNCFAYVFQGSADFAYSSNPIGIRIEKEFEGEELNIRDLSGNRTLIRFDMGDYISLKAGREGVRFLLVAGKPIKEPVAWHGPIVMNTKEELAQAFSDLRNGTFIKPLH